ncbi:MAG TPA: LysM peptidoglycan-binding domain-containing protein [Chthoniobacterales bacterium]|nr:LysM peptidoglycan-binding domain-containing protein [Chthoniobacterales bacterium]
MKPHKSKHRIQRLRARTATMDQSSEFEDYGTEPNMKLSHAFMVVLALHIIAVGGLFAFNKAKAGHSLSKAKSEVLVAKDTQAPESGEATATTTQNNSLLNATPLKNAAIVKGGTIATTAVAASASHAIAKEPVAKENSSANKNLKTYQVVKGDTLAKIASRLKTSLADLKKANGLGEHAVLHIGQQLKVPGKLIGASLTASAVTKVAATTTMPPSGGGSVLPIVSTNSESSDVSSVSSKTTVTETPIAPANTVSVPVNEVHTVTSVPVVEQSTTSTSVASSQNVASVQESAVGESVPKVLTASEGSMTEYTIVKGDNPYKIAKRFYVNYDELMKINNITDPRKIQIGQKLMIPGKQTIQKKK